MKHLLRKALFILMALILGAGGAWAETKTYQHVFNAKPSGSSATLSGVDWSITSTSLGAYNSSNYAGVQLGTSKANGKLVLTSASSWAGAISEVRLWLNLGGTSVTPSVTIGGKSATSDGTTVVKNSEAGADWTKATKVTFTPAAGGNTGVVVINVATVKAGYVCAMEIDYESDGETGGGETGGDTVEPTVFNVNIADGIVGGTVTATPDKAEEKAEITLTATPEAGYLLGAWNVKNASSNEAISVTDSKFIMPAADVSVSASFMKVEPGKAVLSKDTYEAWGASGYLANEGSVTYDVITLSATGTNTDGPVRFNAGNYTHFYKNTKATFTAASGYKITQIVFCCSTADYSADKLSTTDGFYSVEGKEGTWTGNASSVTFMATAQCRANSVTIIYAEDNGEVTPPTPKTFALTYANNDKGTCSATVDGAAVVSGDMVEVGKTVTLSCKPNDGYTFDSWNVHGTESSNTIEVSSVNTFIMPEEAVTVDAKYNEESSTDGTTITWVASEQGYENGVQYTSATIDTNISLAFGDGGNDGKYYNTGTGIRLYANGKLTVSAANGGTISRIVITYSAAGYTGKFSANTGKYTLSSTTGTWTGSASTVVLTNTATSDHARIQKIAVTYTAGEGGETGGETPTTVTTIPNFIKNATLSLAVGDEQYDVRECLNIPADYDTSAYSITTTIDGQTQKDDEFACVYPWLIFLKTGTYTVHITAAAVEGKYLKTEGDITVTVAGGETPQPEVKVYASLAELLADGAPAKEARNVTLTLTDEEIIGIYKTTTKDGNEYRSGIFFKSGEQQVMLYFHDVPTEWVKGGHVSGTLTNCPWKLYSTNWELCPETGWAWSELTYVAPPVVELANVSISGEPTTKDYYTGESFDLAGLTVTANYSDGSSTDVTKKVDWTVSPEVFTAEGKVAVKVTATYEEKTSEEMTYTVNVTKNPYVIAQNFTTTSGKIDENISYEAFQGGGTTAPANPKDSGCIRLYQYKPEDAQYGGYITVKGAKGVTISEVILTTGSTYASTTIGTAIDDAEAPTEGTEVAKNSDFKVSGLNCNSISFYCLGTDKNTRLDVAAIKVKYTKKDISLTEIAISGEGVGKEFIQYAEFDHEGVAVTAKYSDGSSTDVTDKTEFTAPDMTTTGEKTVAVSYTEGGVTKNSSYTINVISETVEAIHIAATGKTLFRLGESFSSEGLSVTADYNSGRKGIELETDQYTVVAPEMETLGKKEVTVALVADEEITVSYAVNIVPANTIFYESFDTNDGTGGNDGQWKGSIASNNIKSDNTWTFTSASGANQCAKFGAGSTAGSAVTSALGHEGSVTVSFKAAAWDGSNERTNITVSIDGDDTSVQTIELTKGEWNDYTLTFNGLNAESKVKFAASQSSNNRFFLDEVVISEATEPDATVCVVTNYIEALKKGEAGYTLDGLEAIINGILMKK